MQPTLTISANATPGVGGQGLNFQHMLEAYGGDFELNVFAAGLREPYRGEPIPASRLASLLGRVPVLRRLRAWQAYRADMHFDQEVARRLGPAALFHGATGQACESFKRAQELGCGTLLDVVTLHADDFFAEAGIECARFGLENIVHPKQRARMRREYELADSIRVMSRVAQATFLKRGFAPEKIVVAHPPMQLEAFPRANFSSSVFRVAFVGLIEPWKGFHYLVDAFNGMREKARELVFWGGTGSRPVFNYFKRVLREHPEIKLRPEAVRKAGFAEVYGKASVLVHPSVCDGFGLVVGEALACGVPVIVTSNAGAADLVTDGQNGFVVPPRDVDAIREKLDFLAANPAKLRAMGAAAAESVKALTLENFKRTLVPRALALCR